MFYIFFKAILIKSAFNLFCNRIERIMILWMLPKQIAIQK